MSILIRGLIAVFLVVVSLGSKQEASAPLIPTPPDSSHSVTIIESVTAQVLPTTPAQIELVVSGYQPNGCEFPVLVDQQRGDNTITVAIYRDIPANQMCTAMLLDYNETIHLDGTFAPGTYTIQVNELQIEVTVPSS